MSRRPTTYDDFDHQPRGSARPDPSYGRGDPNPRPSRPRADDFMASASAYDQPRGGSSRGAYGGGGRDQDGRDHRAGRERDYARDRSRSPPQRSGARSPPPQARRDDYSRRESDGRDGYSRGDHDDRGGSSYRGGAGPGRDGAGGGGGRYDGVRDRREHIDDHNFSMRDDRDPYAREPRDRHDHDPRDRRDDRREDRVDSHAPSARSEREPSTQPLDKAEDAADVDEDAMAAMMGFGGFGTTSGTQVQDNLTAVSTRKERKFRQYMNRRGGFNRPLDKMA